MDLDVNASVTILREGTFAEIFVVAVIRVSCPDEMAQLADSTNYGLNSALT